MPHPIIVTYADTKEATFPLILVIGREPNSSKTIDNIIGSYDFEECPKTQFWNISYSVIAGTHEWEGKKLKRKCKQWNESPIIYADALPIGIPNKTKNKDAIRRELAPAAIQKHIDNLFSHDHIIERVQLVIASGLDGPRFRVARKKIQELCEKRGKKFVRVPYFHGVNKQKIEEALSQKTRGKIRKVLNTFKDQVQIL